MVQIYSGRAQSNVARNDISQHKASKAEQAPAVGAVLSKPAPQQQVIPDIVPMRRGRPTTSAHGNSAPAPDVAPARRTDGDPFAALDAKASPKVGMDELSSRFPTLDQFSLLHDHGAKFDFDASSPTSPQAQQPSSTLNQKVTERLADEAFAMPQPSVSHHSSASRPHSLTPVGHQAAIASPPPDAALSKVSSAPGRPEISRARSIISNNPELQAISSQTNSRYVSTGTMTATPPPEPHYREVERPIQTHDYSRSASATRQQPEQSSGPRGYEEPEPRAVLPRTSSFQRPDHLRQPSSSRPSLEGGRPRADFLETSARTSQPVIRSRPVSTNLENTTLDFLREREAVSRSSSRPPQVPSPNPEAVGDSEARAPSSDMEFLRSLEDSDRPKSSKRSSITSLSGNKNMLVGKFGDAFKRFEGGTSSPGGGRSPSPRKEAERRDLTPIAGSEATDGRSDDGRIQEDEDALTPEMRRELERRKLQEEEQRVATAQAEYRKRVAEGNRGPQVPPKSIGGVSRVTSIQNRVQSLLNEEQKPSVQRTAQGYGKYTDYPEPAGKPDRQTPGVPKKPLNIAKTRGNGPTSSSSAPPALTSKPPAKPIAPKKPVHLNSLPTGQRPASPQKLNRAQTSSEQLAGEDLPGRPVLDMASRDKDDYLQDFSKRFPSLGTIEMVEREIGDQNAGSRRR